MTLNVPLLPECCDDLVSPPTHLFDHFFDEPPEKPITQPGDVWTLGQHRVVCGDATQADVVGKALKGVRPHLMVTDPPYGVNYDPEWRSSVIDAASGRTKAGRALGKVKNDDRADWRQAWSLFPGDVAYVWHSALYSDLVRTSLEASGFEVRSQIIWDKGRMVISRGHYHWRHEPCWYVVRKGRTAHWSGDRKQCTIWPIMHLKSASGHGTQKPVEAMRRPMENNSQPGDVVYDPFVGSGTTIIAAQSLGRVCHAVELDPAYVDLAVRRWERMTGRLASRSAS
ncbi:DNA-methyltransferase [Lichenifustis flavocetrariae]|uniref:Methyltransferase n=1 Tax=Lichenifustis flavocetrariae TaxID=2949735 RepID=A0AA41Z3G3_9HYPH|nr:site-specific DNA-methyltransferase [Lichenifustis flavocetrariae]MCW6509803.1 site-specific DNA-methyltransferase [Lichenifustis flavocetrariae]